MLPVYPGAHLFSTSAGFTSGVNPRHASANLARRSASVSPQPGRQTTIQTRSSARGAHLHFSTFVPLPFRQYPACARNESPPPQYTLAGHGKQLAAFEKEYSFGGHLTHTCVHNQWYDTLRFGRPAAPMWRVSRASRRTEVSVSPRTQRLNEALTTVPCITHANARACGFTGTLLQTALLRRTARTCTLTGNRTENSIVWVVPGGPLRDSSEKLKNRRSRTTLSGSIVMIVLPLTSTCEALLNVTLDGVLTRTTTRSWISVIRELYTSRA